MGRLYLKPDAEIVAEMMRRGALRGNTGIGSRDPGPELVGRAHRAVEIAKRKADRDFKYPRSDYPFDRHDENEEYRKSFDVGTTPASVRIKNTAPSAQYVEHGRDAMNAPSGKYLALPLKRQYAEALKRSGKFVTEYRGRPLLLVKRVREFNGYQILSDAVRESFSR